MIWTVYIYIFIDRYSTYDKWTDSFDRGDRFGNRWHHMRGRPIRCNKHSRLHIFHR
jgi:hypothetical protein